MRSRRSASTSAMLRLGTIRPGQTTAEVRPRRCTMGWYRSAGASHGSRGGDNASTEATITPFRLPVEPESSYIGVNEWRMGRPSRKCRIKSYIEERCTSCELASLFDVADSVTRSEHRARSARGADMADQLTSATWFWLLVPILACVGLSILTMIFRRKAER